MCGRSNVSNAREYASTMYLPPILWPAIAVYGDSYLMFHEDSILKFTNNSAKQRGGAIFVDTQLAFAPCFFNTPIKYFLNQ